MVYNNLTDKLRFPLGIGPGVVLHAAKDSVGGCLRNEHRLLSHTKTEELLAGQEPGEKTVGSSLLAALGSAAREYGAEGLYKIVEIKLENAP